MNWPAPPTPRILPEYLIRHYFYVDFTRQQAVAGEDYWVSEQIITHMQFGLRLPIGMAEGAGSGFVVANHPQVREVYDEKRRERIKVVDVFVAPAEQWMLYEHQEPVDWIVEILYEAGEDDVA